GSRCELVDESMPTSRTAQCRSRPPHPCEDLPLGRSVRETHSREGAMTTPEENAATVRELIQRVMNEGDIGFAEKTLSEDYVERSPMPGGTADKAGAIAMFN